MKKLLWLTLLILAVSRLLVAENVFLGWATWPDVADSARVFIYSKNSSTILDSSGAYRTSIRRYDTTISLNLDDSSYLVIVEIYFPGDTASPFSQAYESNFHSGTSSSVDSQLISNIMHRVGHGTPKGSGSDSSTLAERDATVASMDANVITASVIAAGAINVSEAPNLDAAITSRLAPTVAARMLDVAATGEAGVDFNNILGGLGATEIDANAIGASEFAVDARRAIARENWTISSADDSTYAASTMGLNSKEWDFGSGGSGSGSDSVITYDTTNSVVVPRITVTMRNLAGTSAPLAIVTTDQNGAAVILLNDSGQITAAQSGFTAILDTINTLPGPDTIFLTSFNPGTPTDNSFSRVFGFIRYTHDSAAIGAEVTASLRGGPNMRDTVSGLWVAPQVFTTSTDVDGYFFMDIRKTAFLNQPASYNIEAKINGRRIFLIAGFAVDDLDSVEVIP